MLLSICITSYDRVKELERCLRSIDYFSSDIEIIVSEDCSPRKNEIKLVAEKFGQTTKNHFRFFSNSINLGFDKNLKNLINLAKGKYILFVTDDDAFLPKSLAKLIMKIRELNLNVAFTPYFDRKKNKLQRFFKNSFHITKGFNSVSKYLYSSILLSGLIFKRDLISDYDAIKFNNLIYSQVYLFCKVLNHHHGYYINIPLIDYIGDGINSFGKNSSAKKNKLLADRQSIFSNLEYHKRLIKVIKLIQKDLNIEILNKFSNQYSLKSYSGLYRARLYGLKELNDYWIKLNKLQINLSIYPKVYYLSLMVLGCKLSDAIFFLPKKFLTLKKNI